MWKCTGRCWSEHTSHSGSQARLARSGPPTSLGSDVMFTPRRSMDATRLASATAVVDVPGREDRHGQEAAARVGLHVGHGVVVDLHAQQPQLGVLHDVGDALAAEADGIGEADLCVDAGIVHHLDARLDVERAQVDLVLGPLEERLGGAALAAVAVDDPAAAGKAELGTVDVPHGPALDLDHVRDAVLILGRGPLGPQVVGLRQVRVRINDTQAVECKSHRVPPRSASMDNTTACVTDPPTAGTATVAG